MSERRVEDMFDCIHRLEAESAKLRAALEQIAEFKWETADFRDIARAALEETK